MLRDFFKRRERTAVAPAARAPAPESAPRPVIDHAELRPVERDVLQVTAWLKADVAHRIGALRDALSREGRDSDAPALLDLMGGSFDAVVRQPPLAAQRALSVSRDPDASSARLVGLVETDPGLGQGLLRYANSAFYATRGGRCVSLMNAVQRVGTTGVHNVVLRTMVDGLLCRPGGSFQSWVDLSWEHMVRTAPLARAIAPVFAVQPDEAYALGLLHDVGKLVVFDRLGELRRQLRRDLRLPPAIISASLKFLHEPLGGLAALQWGLGGGVAQAIATHHRSPVPEGRDLRCELIYLAERLDLWRLTPEGCQAAPPLAQWWTDGQLTGSMDAVRSVIDQLAPDDELEPAV